MDFFDIYRKIVEVNHSYKNHSRFQLIANEIYLIPQKEKVFRKIDAMAALYEWFWIPNDRSRPTIERSPQTNDRSGSINKRAQTFLAITHNHKKPEPRYR